ncbi:hypothetical protein QYE76_048920 [Lolium multiflorum]|uniref:Uncharacterized protein n=1 Tax=Lolium multiflorum TaxID=4521 RepID=A0AAD8WGD0_LOLMU|nr:hypothetical protein QYE76_048920 [Lolium multiflorum]
MELKKRKDDISLLTMSTEGMSPQTRAAHNFFKGQILDNIEAKMAVAEAATVAATLTPEQAPVDTSAIASASTPASASASASATEHAH